MTMQNRQTIERLLTTAVCAALAVSAAFATPRPNGGYLAKPFSGKVFRIVNAQTRLDDEAVKTATAGFIAEMRLWSETVKPGAPANPNVGLTIEIVDEDGDKTILSAPEQRWGRLNLRPLTADSPDKAKLALRVQKEFWRLGAFVLGAGYSNWEGCLMRPISTLAALDRAPAAPCPEPFNQMMDSARAAGLGVKKTVSYRQACSEGWAPAPTNDVQKAIWNEIHALPSEPIKIKPETKKVTK